MRMVKRYMSFLICWMLICYVSVFAQETNKYEFAKLSYLANQMNDVRLPATSAVFVYPNLSNSKLVININAKGQVSHLGFALFSDDVKQLLDPKACSFIERFILELALLKSPDLVNAKLKEYKCSLYLNGRKYQSSVNSLFAEIQQMGIQAEFSLQQNTEIWEAVWRYGSPTKEVLFTFPNYRELVDGTDKNEADIAMFDLLVQNQNRKISVPLESLSENSVLDKETAVYIYRGVKALENTYTSDKYYLKSKDGFTPLFTRDYPNYALSNVFQIPGMANNFSLNIRHDQYGRKTGRVTISLPSFLDLFKKDFNTYTFVRGVSGDVLEAYVVFNHKHLNYMHLLQLSINENELFSGKERILMDAIFRSNVPQHYIKTLVDDKN